jgi:hypothetical protein
MDRTSVSPACERPVFVLTIQFAGTAGFEMHALRRLLKSLIRNYRFRVISIENAADARAPPQ